MRKVDALSKITEYSQKSVTSDDAKHVLDAYTVEFYIPNPLFGEVDRTLRRFDPNHQSVIICHATLLDDISTEADILAASHPDSTDNDNYAKEYRESNIREGMFRIRLTMESGFSRKSMEPDLWSLYLENASGTMIEPSDIVVSDVVSARDSTYSRDLRMSFNKNVFRRDFTLYFKRVTFFGEDLFGEKNPYIVLAISREKKVLARVAWSRSSDGKKLSVKRQKDIE